MDETQKLILESLQLLLETEAERRTDELKEHRHPLVTQHNESIRYSTETKLLAIEALLNPPEVEDGEKTTDTGDNKNPGEEDSDTGEQPADIQS